MTEQDFRNLALGMPEALESAHHGHADFRVEGKVFASLGYPKAGWGMVKLTPEQQRPLIAEKPGVFAPASGAWGEKGATCVLLERIDRAALRGAILAAWRNTAPKRLL